jgi:hypothetical protein
MFISTRLVLFVAMMVAVVTARACDLCGCYTPQLEALPRSDEAVPSGQMGGLPAASSWNAGLYGAVGEQFTHFGTVQVDGHEVANPSGQHEDSSITQLVAGYIFNSRLALQLNVPLIYRSFQRPEGFAIDHGTEAGLGDISLLGQLVVFRTQSGGGRDVEFDGKSPRMVTRPPDFTASIVLLTGIKLPTGDSSRIKEEFHEVEVPGAPVSGIHGHDLTLGTGSVDGIFGGEGSLRYKSAFFEADIQFMLRGDGLHQYHFANDLSASGGPGYYLIRTKRIIIGAQLVASADHKDVDRFRGSPADDTGMTSVFLGPRVVASIGKMSAEVGADFPVSIDNTALQVVPDYRLRAGFSLRF